MTRYIGKYINSCDMCQRMKNKIEVTTGKLKLSEVPKILWILLWNALDTNIFLFLLSIFLDFIFLFF